MAQVDFWVILSSVLDFYKKNWFTKKCIPVVSPIDFIFVSLSKCPFWTSIDKSHDTFATILKNDPKQANF